MRIYQGFPFIVSVPRDLAIISRGPVISADVEEEHDDDQAVVDVEGNEHKHVRDPSLGDTQTNMSTSLLYHYGSLIKSWFLLMCPKSYPTAMYFTTEYTDTSVAYSGFFLVARLLSTASLRHSNRYVLRSCVTGTVI